MHVIKMKFSPVIGGRINVKSWDANIDNVLIITQYGHYAAHAKWYDVNSDGNDYIVTDIQRMP